MTSRKNCVRAGVFSRDVVGRRDAALWSNAIAWFLSMVFSRDLPIRMTDLAAEGSPENEVIRQARSAITKRLATMIFHKDRVEDAITSFREHPVPPFPESAGHQTETSDEVTEHVVDLQPAGWDTTSKADGEAESHSAAGDEVPDIYVLLAEKLPEFLPDPSCRKCARSCWHEADRQEHPGKARYAKPGPPKFEIGGRVHYRKRSSLTGGEKRNGSFWHCFHRKDIRALFRRGGGPIWNCLRQHSECAWCYLARNPKSQLQS